MTETAPTPADDLDPVWKALADATRRAILDFLRDRPRTTTEIVETFPHLSRFGVMKHIDVLRQARLVLTREEGRQRMNSLNVVPIRQIYERWVSPFQELWTGELLRIKEFAEQDGTSAKAKTPHKKNKPKATHHRMGKSKNARPTPTQETTK